jgi:hypothetical protein
MNLPWVKLVWILAAAFSIGILADGCTTNSTARLKEQNAFLAGQNTALRQQMAAAANSVTVNGAVQNHQVPWVAGLTLAQAIATASYVGAEKPKVIILTHQGESARLDADILLSGPAVPLEPGDVVEIR